MIRLLEGHNDSVRTDILARAHLSMYLLRSPDRVDKVQLLFSSTKDSDLVD